jgi:dUTP pyrophosphatase
MNMAKETKTKRFYKVGEMVWSIADKQEAKILGINKEEKSVDIELGDGKKATVKLWHIDKLKYKAKERLAVEKAVSKNNLPTVYFAKVRPDAIIPSKRKEDAGYDIYANLEGRQVEGDNGVSVVHEIYCPAQETTLVPTGIASALPKTHYLNAKHERGSTGVISMSVLAGVVDSGYRGEIFIAITPLSKDVLITSETDSVVREGNVILYPYSKAIAQATIELVPEVNIVEIPFEELKNIDSERGDTKLGQSGK